MVTSQDFKPAGTINGASGGTLPAQWEPHAATLMAYPFGDELWFGQLKQVRAEYDELVLNILKGEDVVLVVPPGDVAQLAHAAWAGHPRLTVCAQPLNDGWLRDSGPIVVRPSASTAERAVGSPVGLDFIFNAWGDKFESHLDDLVARKLCDLVGLERRRIPFVFEGGSLDVDGAGTALTTEQCLLEAHRNPAYSRDEIDAFLRGMFELKDLVWLGRGLEGDHTDGHIDTLARFIAPGTVACHFCEDKSHPSYVPLNENLRQLEALAGRGHPAIRTVVPVPVPKKVVTFAGDYVPFSYVNFYFCNAGLLVPQFSDENDERVLEILERHLPEKKVVGLKADHIVLGGGVFNCLTQQVPRF